MKKLVIVGLLGALAGCGGGDAATNEAMTKMEAARDQACACKDVACAEQVKAELRAWAKANMPRLRKSSKPTKAYQAKFGELSDAADGCIERLKAAAGEVVAEPPVMVDPRRPATDTATPVPPAPIEPPSTP